MTMVVIVNGYLFQSSFELTGYITSWCSMWYCIHSDVSKLFRAYGLYNEYIIRTYYDMDSVSKLFRAYGLYNCTFSMILMT